VTHYRITAKLGQGSMDECTTKFRREVAIKTLPQRSRLTPGAQPKAIHLVV
jgi:hypothetical protein